MTNKEILIAQIAKELDERYPKPSDEYIYGSRKVEAMRLHVWNLQVNKLYAFEYGWDVNEMLPLDDDDIEEYSRKLRAELRAFRNK